MATEANRRRRADLAFGAAAVSLAVVFAATWVVRSVEPLGIDQGLFACFARWVPRGWLPYRDLFDSKPPLFLYSYALSRLCSSDLVRGVWRFEALWLAATMTLGWALAARVWDRAAGLATAALLFAGLWAPGFGGYWSRAQADELVALPLLGAAWLALVARDRPRAALWAGVLTGVAGLFKIPAMAVAAAWPIAWLMTAPRAWGRVARMALGLALPWALALAWFAAHGALGDFWDGVFVYAGHNAEFIAPPWSHVLPTFARELCTGAPLLVAAAAVGVALLVRRRAREAWWVVPWIALTMAAVILERQLAGYHYLLIVPGLAMAGGFAVAELARGVLLRDRRLAAAVGLAAVAALAVQTGASFFSAYRLDAMHAVGSLTRGEYLDRLQPAGFSSRTEEDAARFLRERTQAGDGVLVWGLSPGLYALADRHPVTRYAFHKLLLTDAPLSRLIPGLDERRRRFLDGLGADPPAYVLVGRHDRNGFEPEDSFTSMMRWDELRELLHRDYEPETQLGAFVILRRRATPAAATP